MNKKQIALSAALLCLVAQPSIAAEYKYRLITNRVGGFSDVRKGTRSEIASVYAGKFFQWFGSPYPCPKSGSSTSSPCTYKRTGSKAVATSWKFGDGLTVKETYPSGEITAQVTAEFNQTITDTDTFEQSYVFDPGVTAEPATYIDRDLKTYQYLGAWVRVQDHVLCRPIVSFLPLCDKYEWKSGQEAGRASTLRERSSEQSFTYLTYPNGQRPGYKLEAN